METSASFCLVWPARSRDTLLPGGQVLMGTVHRPTDVCGAVVALNTSSATGAPSGGRQLPAHAANTNAAHRDPALRKDLAIMRPAGAARRAPARPACGAAAARGS